MISKAINILKSEGAGGVAKRIPRKLKSIMKALPHDLNLKWKLYRYSNAPKFYDPNIDELIQIEKDFKANDIPLLDLVIPKNEFIEFSKYISFPKDYVGGPQSNLWEEKLLEHFISYKLLNLKNYENSQQTYIDIAACSSPWVSLLRKKQIHAYAIDLALGEVFKGTSYYKVMDATQMTFEDNSVSSASLQCAYEMFADENDIKLIKELARVLKVGGKAIITPLYTHTHYCHYSTPEYYSKGYGDTGSKEYIKSDMGRVPMSRFYNAIKLKERVLTTISEMNMSYNIYVFRNKKDFNPTVYMHFILEIIK